MPQKQMVINYMPGEECRVAVVNDGQLEDLHAERAGSVSYVGNIYVGKVVNVEAGIQAAFIDFGLDNNGFLHVSDLHPKYFPGEEKTERIGKKTPRRERPPIQACLKRGQEIIVQVLKEGINTKGPTLTSYLSIPGRYLVMLPWMDRVGVSRKVEDDDQRREMRKALDGLELPEGFGFILRTAGMGRNKTELKRDLAYLQRLWKDIEKRRAAGRQPRLLYAESDLLMRSLRDVWTTEIQEIIIDNEDALRRAARFMKIVSPRSSTRLLNYDRGTPLFHAFGIEEQIARMHAREVPLPSGGSLVIDETEAMIAIDVNSGKMRDHSDAETTAFRTNREAVDEICRQLRLRDLGGLIVCDLIDMMKRSNRRTIEQQIRDHLKGDRAATKVLPISQFGLIEMTRQRVRGSLRSVHFAKCPTCSGRGLLQRPDSVAADAMRDLAKYLDHEKVAKIEMVVSSRVASIFLSAKRQTLSELERRTNKHVDVRVSEDIAADRIVMYAYDADGADIEIARLPASKPPRNLTEWTDSGAPDDDWAVDVLQELEDGADDDAAESPETRAGESADESAGGRKKRRRRRRRGRRAEGDAEDADREARDAEDAAPDPAADEPREDHPHEASSAGDPAEDSAGGRKKRRRRRRRGRRTEGDSADLAPLSDGREPSDAASEHSGSSGDAPEEARTDETARDADESEDEANAPAGKKRRRARRPRKKGKGELDDQPRAANEDEHPEPKRTAHDEPDNHADESAADAPGGKKRRRRRRRASSADGAPAASADSTKAAQAAEKKPVPTPAPSTNGTPAAEADKPKPPKRTLYSNRRRLSSGEAAALKGSRDE